MTSSISLNYTITVPVVKEPNPRLVEKWKKLHLPDSILRNHLDCAEFLIDSGLAFTIVGFRHEIRVGRDGHPEIKMEGEWTRWSAISNRLYYDATSERIKSRVGGQVWSYYHPQGLVPSDPLYWDRAFPVYELTHEEYRQTLAHAQKFYETNPEQDPGMPKDCIVQFFSSERRQGVPDHPLLENLHRNIPVHIGTRLITPDGKVYSFGILLPTENSNEIFADFFSTLFASTDTKISMVDYEEFRRHEGRMVTSIPLTSERCQKILQFVSEKNSKQIRYQYGRQNCSVFTREVLQLAGYDVNTRITAKEMLWDILPSLGQIPAIGPSLAKIQAIVQQIFEAIPEAITTPFQWTFDIVLYIPSKIATVFINLILWKMGSAKQFTPLAPGMAEEELGDTKRSQSFSAVIRDWTDLIKEETQSGSHSKNMIAWQKAQKSTFIEPYAGVPKLSIVPPRRN